MRENDTDKQPDELDVALGQAVKALRKQRGLSQTELGDALGVTFQQIQKYERGANRISFSALVRIAGTLGCTPASLVASVGSGGDSAEAALENQFGPAERELLGAFGEIKSNRLREAVLDLARKMAEF